MQEEMQVSWVKDSDFLKANPCQCHIVGYKAEGKDRLLIFTIGISAEERQMSCWGDNKNALIRAFGKDTDEWIGKTFRLTSTTNDAGKRIRIITA